MQTLHQLLDLLSAPERRRAYLLLGMILLMALCDMVGVASIMPFMAVLANPEVIETNAVLNTLYTRLGFTDPQQFLFLLGSLVFVLLVFSLAFKALTTYAQLRFIQMREYTIGKRLVEGYLHQPYDWFLSRHSADLGKTVLTEVEKVITLGLRPMLLMIAHGAVAMALLVLLIAVDPLLALTVGLVLGGAYGLIYTVTRRYLRQIGSERLAANQARFTAVGEGFGAAKDVKINGLEDAYTRRFAQPAQTYARHQASAQAIAQLPRFALEAIAFGGMLLVMLYLLAQSGDFANVLPVVALYAFAGYRLMPAVQNIFASMTNLRFAGPALTALHADLMSLSSARDGQGSRPMPLNTAITLDAVEYTYPNAPEPALKQLSLTVPARSTVGLVGTTGCGKTTTVDVILGLLTPQHGKLLVDGTPITPANRRSWQRAIGYVPQQIYLSDDTVAANIAFGVDPDSIDQQAVERAARIANLHGFVVDELPKQYQTTVGERGVRLSGGQRQRIGIARALYHNPQVLILDEATSALDNLTEQAVMDAVHNLGNAITIILIAHRLSTVRDCDTIFLLDKGRLAGQGTFNQLTNDHAGFRAMAVG